MSLDLQLFQERKIILFILPESHIWITHRSVRLISSSMKASWNLFSFGAPMIPIQKSFLVGGFNPSEKILVKLDSQSRGKNKKYSKPPPSFVKFRDSWPGNLSKKNDDG